MAREKRQRLTAEQTRERLIGVGLDALAEEGMTLGLGAVNLERAVRQAQVPRSSAYAVWSTDEVFAPQELFQREVLRRAVEDRRVTVEAVRERTYEFMGDMPTGLAPSELFRRLVRFVASANFETVTASRSWQIVIALRAILHTAPDEARDAEFERWMRDSEEELRNHTIEEVYKPMADFFGLTPRGDYGDAAFQYGEIAAAALSEGLSLRTTLTASDYLYGVSHPDSHDDDPWTLYSVVFEGIVLKFFEPRDPEAWERPGALDPA